MSKVKFLLTIEYEIDGTAPETAELVDLMQAEIMQAMPGVMAIDNDQYAVLINGMRLELAKK